MALYTALNKPHHLLSRYAVILSSKFFRNIYNQEAKIALDVDTLDEFTNQLIQKKSDEWEIMRTRRKLNNSSESKSKSERKRKSVGVQLSNLHHLNTLLQDAVDVDNASFIKDILDECKENKQLPTFTVLLQVLSYYSQTGRKDEILCIIELCRECHPAILNEYSDFKHYLAKATWIKGNISEAIILFENVYGSNVYLRRNVRSMLKYLIEDAVENRSEAALVSIIKFSERLIQDFKDYYMMACIWRACFLSEWYTDHCIAIDLLKQHKALYKAISNQIPFIITIALRNHQLEIVYRLLEVSLKLEQKSQTTVILEILFDYRVRQGDLRGCSEIIQWSLNQGVTLPIVQQEKFVNLLTSYKQKPLENMKKDIHSNTPCTPEYPFKF